MPDDRVIFLEYNCAECGQHCVVKSEQKLFLIVGTQLAAETQQLYCDECNE